MLAGESSVSMVFLIAYHVGLLTRSNQDVKMSISLLSMQLYITSVPKVMPESDHDLQTQLMAVRFWM